MAKVLLLTLYKPQRNPQVAPPLGLLYLAASLRAAGHTVRLLDMRARREPIELHLPEIIAFGPDVIGFSSVIFEADALHDAIQMLKSSLPLARVVVGGPYAHGFLLHVLRIPGLDAAVRGEGERVLPALIAGWVAGDEHPDLPGVGYPGVGIGREPEPIADLDDLPWPAWDLVDMDLYHHQPRHGYILKHQRYFSVSTSRGCPYRCGFCLNPFGRQFRARSPESVVAEIEHLVREYDIGEIHFVDETFNLDLPRAKRICDLIVHRGLEIAIAFPDGLRADRMDRELIDKLAGAGCFKIAYHIETASPRLQKLLEENLILNRIAMVIDYTVRAGMIAAGYFTLGFPGETEDEMRQTIDFALDSKLTLVAFNLAQALPGTTLWDIASREGKTQDFDPARLGDDAPPIHLAAASPKIVRQLLRRVHLRFYLNPRRWWRIWRALPQRRQFFSLVKPFVGKLTWPKVEGS